MKLRLLSILTGAAVVSIGLSACGSTTTTTNVNANLRNANSNTAVVVNATATPAGNTNRWSNTNVNRADYDRDRSDYERDRGSSTIGTGANDSWLWFKTRAALLTTNDLRESTINVDVVNDVVTLKGSVETAAEKTKAAQVAKDIDGVKSVNNQLTVAPDDSMTNTSENSNSGANRNANRR